MWRLFSLISFLTGVIVYCRIKMKRTWFDKSRQGYGGYYYEYSRPTAGDKITKLYFGIKIDGCNVHIIFKTEGILEKVMKLFWICREFQTGDREFDRKVFIIADDPIVSDVLRSSPSLRQEILQLFTDRSEIEVKNITLCKGYAWVELPPKNWETFNVHASSRIIHTLNQMQQSFLAKTTPESTVHYTIYRALQIFNFGLLMAGCLFFIFPFRLVDSVNIVSWDHINQIARTTTIGYAMLFLLVIVIVFKRTSYLMLLLRDFVLMGIISFYLFAYLAYRSINIEFDTAWPSIKNVEVIEKEIHRSRRSTSYYLTISDWRDSDKTHLFTVTPGVYHSMPNSGPVSIKVHKGFLNDEWVEY